MATENLKYELIHKHRDLRLEVWKSDENREERHYFAADIETSGCDKSPYIFGYNPSYVQPVLADQIIKLITGKARLVEADDDDD